MSPVSILVVFLILRFAQHLAERHLATLNKRFYENSDHRSNAMKILSIPPDDMQKTLEYSRDKFALGRIASWVSQVVTLVFIGFAGLGALEAAAKALVSNPIATGLVFFGLVGLASFVISLPFDYYRIFFLEERHGYNRQTKKQFFVDRLKGVSLGIVLGGLILSLLLWIMQSTGDMWWFYAWIAMAGFSILTAWLYPTFLAPLFNKFTPLQGGELKDRIDELAAKIGFQTDGIFIMDASTRSSHGNAYFTGVFGKKRIVLFDTLVESMSPQEVVAVLAHELGHFRLRHVRWQLIRGTLMTGVTFFLLGQLLPIEDFYLAFGLDGKSNYGALIVFGLWFGILDFLLQPWENYISRKNEFAADAFAKEKVGNVSDLGGALLKLREKSNVMPISHPLFSSVYHSHPPLLERLSTMGYAKN